MGPIHCLGCPTLVFLASEATMTLVGFKFFFSGLKKDISRVQLFIFSLHDLFNDWLIDCMVFNTAFNSISSISWQPVHLSMLSLSSFNQYCSQYSFQLLSHITIVETIDSGERNESCCNDYHQSSERLLAEQWIEPATSWFVQTERNFKCGRNDGFVCDGIEDIVDKKEQNAGD